MTCRRQTIYDRIHNVVVRCEKLATRCADLDSNSVIWSDQRRPSLGNIRLPGHSEHETIHHFAHDAGICFVTLDRIRLVDRVYNRRRRRRLLASRQPVRDGAKENESYLSHQHDGVDGTPIL